VQIHWILSFNQCGAFKTGFVGTKWQKLPKQRA